MRYTLCDKDMRLYKGLGVPQPTSILYVEMNVLCVII